MNLHVITPLHVLVNIYQIISQSA